MLTRTQQRDVGLDQQVARMIENSQRMIHGKKAHEQLILLIWG
jgi:predicted AAA+ superfamily ATPase